jgi:DGQHR domain-containing protein
MWFMNDRMGLRTHEGGLEAAMKAAYADSMSSGAQVFPCTVFQQGGRTMISTSFPFPFLSNRVEAQSARKGDNPTAYTNRPLMPDHVKSIRQYMLDNVEDYILPPVTLNVRELPSVHVPSGNMKFRLGFMVITDSVRFFVTDGQHRIAALKGLGGGRTAMPAITDVEPRFLNDSLSALVVVEEDIQRIHQDFADAAQTKQIPPSLLAVYNTREPLNNVLNKLVSQSPLFRDRVDMTSRSLAKASTATFLLNQIRQFVKELLFSDYALAEATVPKMSHQRIGSLEDQNTFVEETLALLDILSKHMTPWDKIVDLPSSGGPATQIPDFRTKYLNMTATGLVVIGRVVHHIRKNLDTAWREEQYIRLATEIDWSRDANLWRGNVVSPDGKISTQRGPVKVAAEMVKRSLGLEHDPALLAKAEFERPIQ